MGKLSSEMLSASAKDTQLVKFSLTLNPIPIITQISTERITERLWGDMLSAALDRGTHSASPLEGIWGNKNALELTAFLVMVSACLGFHTSVYSLSGWCLLTYLFFFTGKKSQWIFNQIELDYLASDSERLLSHRMVADMGIEIFMSICPEEVPQGVRVWGLPWGLEQDGRSSLQAFSGRIPKLSGDQPVLS